MTDHIRADPGVPVDLLVIGGLTIDVLDGDEVAGGAARYATEGALAAGMRVALQTVSGPEPIARAMVKRLGVGATVLWQEAPTSIVFEHHGAHDQRRLRLRSGTESIRVAGPPRLPPTRAVLFAPVAGEVSADALRGVTAPVRAAGLQGWLRRTDVDGWVDRRPLSAVDEAVADALRGITLLVASVDELRGDAGPEAMARLRAWAGPRAELVVTAGTAGAWVGDGHAAPRHVPAEVVPNRHTIGAGDAFAAVLTARRGAGRDLWSAATEAAVATARFLANRVPATIAEMGERDTAADLAGLDETRWRATRFGPGLQHAPAPESEFTLEIQGDRLAGRSGCNRFMGTWSTEDGRLRIGQLASTMMFCDGLMELEGAYLAALQSATGVRADEAGLTLVGPDGAAVMELARETLAPET